MILLSSHITSLKQPFNCFSCGWVGQPIVCLAQPVSQKPPYQTKLPPYMAPSPPDCMRDLVAAHENPVDKLTAESYAPVLHALWYLEEV